MTSIIIETCLKFYRMNQDFSKQLRPIWMEGSCLFSNAIYADVSSFARKHIILIAKAIGRMS